MGAMRRLLLSVLLGLHAPSAIAGPAFPAGYWYGEGQPYDNEAMWLAHLSANGDFSAQFRACRRASDEWETGSWSLKGDIETIRTLTSNGRAVQIENSYKILSFDGRKQVYLLIRTGFVYHAVRVDEKFRLPPCGLTS